MATPATPLKPSDSPHELTYKLAVRYYRTAGTQELIEYNTNSQLMALNKQITRGPFIEENEPDLGWFDFVGHDRRAAWEDLGDMSKPDAMSEFVTLLETSAPAFTKWLAAKKAEIAEQERLERVRLEEVRARQERERQERERQERDRQDRIRLQEQERAQLEQKRREEMAAEHQRQQQATAQQQAATKAAAQQQAAAAAAYATASPATAGAGGDGPADVSGAGGEAAIAAFRTSLGDNPDYAIVVGRGEVVRVRVPNRVPGSTRLLWSFCTEQYDIGFGLDFEVTTGDADPNAEIKIETLSSVDRVQAHEELQSGSHVNPVPGNWLLVFDNSYSILRGKKVSYKCDLK